MYKTSTKLADGRDLMYFDFSEQDRRDVPADPRELPEVSTSSQMRFDPLLGEWVVMAAHRQTRTFQPSVADCPLCPSKPGAAATEIPSSDYRVAVFENRFPSLSPDAEVADPIEHPLVPVLPGRGRCEVVCFSSDHEGSFAELSPEHARLVIDAWADRTTELLALDGVEQVYCFENRGHEIGVTLGHPHGQIYAFPYVTPRSARMLDVAREHRQRTGSDLTEDIIAAELDAGTRIVLESDHWLAFVPAAARWPVEVHVHPRRRVRTIAELDDAERDDLARMYLDLLQRFDRLYDAPLPYIAAWHQAPNADTEDLSRLHLQLFSVKRAADKLKFLAGTESGMGAFMNDVLPEDIAQRLRDI